MHSNILPNMTKRFFYKALALIGLPIVATVGAGMYNDMQDAARQDALIQATAQEGLTPPPLNPALFEDIPCCPQTGIGAYFMAASTRSAFSGEAHFRACVTKDEKIALKSVPIGAACAPAFLGNY
jgi:hypothetical protein